MFKNLIFNLKVLHFNKWQCIIIFIWLHISNLWMTLQHLIQYQQLSLHWILEKCLLFLTFYCKLCTSTWLDLWVRRYFYTHYISLYLQCSPTLWESFIQFTENQNRTTKKKSRRENFSLFDWLNWDMGLLSSSWNIHHQHLVLRPSDSGWNHIYKWQVMEFLFLHTCMNQFP